jgi:ribosomal protein L40E
MYGKFMVHAEDDDPLNNISIECSDIEDMDNYANACREQGYKNVRTKVKPIAGIFTNMADESRTVPVCARCYEPMLGRSTCPFCGQEIERGN